MTIQPGDVVLATWYTAWSVKAGEFRVIPKLRSHVGRVRDVCDHWSECAGVSNHEGTSVLFEDGEQLPIQYCRILFRPFDSAKAQGGIA